MLKPVWTKVTKTPWQDRATLCGGYGMRMKILHTSHDAPQEMKLQHTSNANNSFATKDRRVQSLASTKRIVVPCESSYVLPGGKSILAATNASKSGTVQGALGYKTYLYNKQQIIDQVIVDRPRSPLVWSASCREDFESSRSRATSAKGRKPPVPSNRNLKSR